VRLLEEAAAVGWGGRIRTCECRYQNPTAVIPANRTPQTSAGSYQL